MIQGLQTLGRWAEFVKISHTIFALPFALASMAIAARASHGWPGWRLFLLIVAAMVCARTCAMAFNRIVDRKYDALNPRTAGRHLPAGAISLPSAWTLWLLSAAGLVAVSWRINSVCFYLSPVAIVVVCFYSLTKRFTNYTHVYLGIALALAPVGAWLAVRGSLSWEPVILGVAVVFWLVGFDIIYAIQDYEFDRRHGLRSLVVAWGPRNALMASFLSHMLMWVVLAGFGLLVRFRLPYFVGMAIILLCLMFEHWLARRRSLNWVNTAFFKLNAVVSAVYLAVTVAEVAFPDFFRPQR
ncbi:MAG: 4-hydroxybenzoate octaprenyltransferase [Verrucomicrobia bacterium]|nr:4-hydroxybenzoate octaprenyltransferase [Verrucomicrobiota bacterium]MBI3867514.1 4-hydroxybenzoate octaprenyltransferase [Verrucomicrobiota bacterium]